MRGRAGGGAAFKKPGANLELKKIRAKNLGSAESREGEGNTIRGKQMSGIRRIKQSPVSNFWVTAVKTIEENKKTKKYGQSGVWNKGGDDTLERSE